MNKKVVLSIFRFFIIYIKYFFLTGSVVCSVAVLLFVILNIKPDLSFGFLKYFSFINPLYGQESFEMGAKEVMQIFSVVSFFIFIIVDSLKFLLKKIFSITFNISLKNKAEFIFAIITIFFALTMFIVNYKNLDKGFYLILSIFYVINIISTFIYLCLSSFLNWVSNLSINQEVV